MLSDDLLPGFSAPVRTWFTEVFAAPTPVQEQTWRHVAAGEHSLVVAPTGSGKTLAAFLWALDRLATEPVPDKQQRCRVLYVSPLKALAVDVERNLTAPLTGISRTAARLGAPAPEITVGMRTGDTSPAERRRIATTPPDILITTPESLFLLLTSAGREVLASVETVIVDEVHAIAGTKRGAHLAVSLERLAELCLNDGTGRDPQRIGLSATVRPKERVARFLGGDRPVTVVAPEAAKTWDLEVVVPLPDMTALEAPASETDNDDAPSRSIWPHVTERVLDLVEATTSTIVFVNSRRVAERLTTRLNELHCERLGLLDGADADHPPPAQVMAQSGASHGQGGELPVIARAHHGSVSKEQRSFTEEALKSGALRCVVATSSLELGIDMGAVDLVVQVASPPSVASGLQRVGRAGHQVGAVSRGVVFPQYRGDLVESAVVLDRMRAGAIEEVAELSNPLDVLAQHLVSMCALEDREVDATLALLRRSAPYANLPSTAYESVLDMLSGRYPSEAFAELRPRLVWQRDTGTLSGRPGSQRLAVTSGGTIPDRGLFGVHLISAEDGSEEVQQRKGASRRVGELDEEMVYESRVGDVITLGTTSWRIEEITHDQVRVSPAPGLPGRLPFWKGDSPARPVELGLALGAFTRELAALAEPAARERLAATGLDEWAADNLLAYLADQREATQQLPSDELIMVERFRDELGDWQVCIHSPLGSTVLAPWALAIERNARDRYGIEVQATAGNDGIVLRVPDTSDVPPGADLVVLDPDELRQVVTEEVAGSALFASRFRECASRALLLPRRDPGARTPLWQQRMRSAQLMTVASAFPEFPIMLETMRECLADVFDLDALVELQRSIAARRTRVIEVETPRASPYARSLLFGYVGEFIYSGDVPLAERRAAALTLDTALLAELLGDDQLRQLLDPAVVDDIEADLQSLSEERRRNTTEELFDLVRTSGPYTRDELIARWSGATTVDEAVAALVTERRIAEVRIAGLAQYAVAEDLPRLRDALGIPVPAGMAVPAAPADPLGDLVLRWARTHAPFTAETLARRYGLGVGVVTAALDGLVRAGTVVHAEFSADLPGRQYCHSRVLAMIKRRTLAALRAELEPVEPAALGRFLPRWHQVAAIDADGRDLAPPGRGTDGVYGTIEQLAGVALPVSMLESFVLPSRVRDYSPALLDELITSGEVTWVGAGMLGENDALVRLVPHGVEPPELETDRPALSDAATELLATLAIGGSWLLDDLVTGSQVDDAPGALWELVWAGHVTCDTFAPVRARLAGTRGTVRRPSRSRTLRAGARRARIGARAPIPTTAGRWSAVRRTEVSITERVADEVLGLLDRYGIVTRGSVVTEDFPGGFSAAYKALARLEETGTCRRGYVIAGLGAAQFALPGAVDQVRGLADPDRVVHVLAAADPANPYGAALPWPPREGHRPGRHPGAVVVLVGGELVLYLERGAKSLLTFGSDGGTRVTALHALAGRLLTGALGTVTLERIDGADVFTHPWRDELVAAGFSLVPQGLRIRPRS